MSLKVFVCAKQVLDPEAPPTLLRIDNERLRVSATGTAEVVNSYDLNALKAAIDLGRNIDVGVTLLTAAPRPSKPLLLKALAAGADRAVALRTHAGPEHYADGRATARRLAALVRYAGDFDLILCGRQASDTNAGVVGPLVAGLLDLPVATFAVGLQPGKTGEVLVDRQLPDGTETVACRLPALVTVSSEVGELDPTDYRSLVAAKTKPLEILDEAQLEHRVLRASRGPELCGLTKVAFERTCELVATDDARRAGAALARRLLEHMSTG